MLGIFKKGVVSAPKELNSPAPFNKKHDQHQDIIHRLRHGFFHYEFPVELVNNWVYEEAKPLSPTSFKKNQDQHQDPLKQFLNTNANAFSFSFGNDVSLAFDPSSHSQLSQQRLFCSTDDIYCIFLGYLDNLCTLNKQYGLTKLANEPMFVIQAYKTLQDRGPYPAHSVLKDLDGSFGFILYDLKAKTVFVSLGADGGVKLFWGISADGSVVISDNLGVIKSSCSKSFAPFPTGCMYHTEGGLMSFEHPKNKMKAISRIDSEGAMCGATFRGCLAILII